MAAREHQTEFSPAESVTGDVRVLATEVELLRRNHAFLEFLDSCKKEETSVSFEEVERKLR